MSQQNDDAASQSQHTFWHILLLLYSRLAAFFCFNYIQFFFLSWLPSYLTDFQHLDIKSMSIIGILPWLGATVGFMGGGSVPVTCCTVNGQFPVIAQTGDFCRSGNCRGERTGDCLYANDWCQFPALRWRRFLPTTPQACWSLLQDIVPADRIGTTGGFVHLLANLAGIMSPAVTGLLIQYGGGYHSAFILASALSLVGIVALLALVRQKRGQLNLA
jgi:sugar phosphate permease